MALLALVAKHQHVRDGQLACLRIEATNQGQLWTEDLTADLPARIAQALPSARVVALYNEIDDDQIVGRVLRYEMTALTVQGRPRAIEEVLQLAIDYWRGVVPARQR